MNRRGFLTSSLGLLVLDWRPPLAAISSAGQTGAHHSGGRPLASSRPEDPPVHPDPRPGITAERVLDTAAVRRKPRIAEIYDMAREIPHIFDGLFCFCHCHDGVQAHRSLLCCFESEQAVGCYGCGAVARVAYKAYKQGKSLAEIRAACDKAFA